MTAHTARSLRIRNVSIALPDRALIRRLSFEVEPGQVVTVMGASGSGKSSLLAYIGGFLQAPFVATGEISLGTQRLNDQAPHSRRAGILFQDDLLFPHLSVAGNLLFGVPAAVRSRAARLALVNNALAQAELAGYSERDPGTLSGGQRARVALLRTLLSEPHLLLLDEPFGKLDAVLRADFRRFVFEHVKRLSLPTLMVTHDAADAEAASGPVVVLE